MQISKGALRILLLPIINLQRNGLDEVMQPFFPAELKGKYQGELYTKAGFARNPKTFSHAKALRTQREDCKKAAFVFSSFVDFACLVK